MDSKATVDHRTCKDHRCQDGVTWCAGCNGFGVLAAGGARKYRVRGQGRNISPNAPVHDDCHGTGLKACGCQPLDAVTLATLSGESVETADVA